LNVGAGDTRITFDNTNVAETLRTGRIIRDMLRRGYALLVEIERDGEKKFERAVDFNEKTNCYIIADFDPMAAQKPSVRVEEEYGQGGGEEEGDAAAAEQPRVPAVEKKGRGGSRKRGRREVSAEGTRAVAVGRSAGG